MRKTKNKKVVMDELTIGLMRKAFEMVKEGKGKEQEPISGLTWVEVMDNLITAYEKALGLK